MNRFPSGPMKKTQSVAPRMGGSSDRAHTPASHLAVVPSPVIVRLLKLGTPAPAMPIAEDLDAALVAVQSDRRVFAQVFGVVRDAIPQG